MITWTLWDDFVPGCWFLCGGPWISCPTGTQNTTKKHVHTPHQKKHGLSSIPWNTTRDMSVLGKMSRQAAWPEQYNGSRVIPQFIPEATKHGSLGMKVQGLGILGLSLSRFGIRTSGLGLRAST